MSDKNFGCFLIVVVLLIIACTVVAIDFNYGQHKDIVATIEKTVIDGGETMFVLREESGKVDIYENVDMWFHGKTNSSDFLMELEVGQTYRFEIIGRRKPFFSLYPNILDYELQP